MNNYDRLSASGSNVRTGPVASKAVRKFIEERQPVIGLHGHLHELGGGTRIGRTLCPNPGSVYQDGVLMGAVIELGDGKVISHQFVTG
jgi:Icc-related predicted phosphoesterase